ncbi:hypothetical protein EXE41_04735 [Halorubrum sp. SD690R]|uniref:hypothetical protein n=1 Tax=Halorubrum sp. SD690R TaxID=2518117 RepID=UPI0010F59C56|nr:hypothetical protein [Halorubrum sp. SD690R]TKX47534.1 hypothetical protein EXE41_04735 [Halorubrum sp. SD690R]
MAVDTVRRLSGPNGQQQLLSGQITQFDWQDEREITSEDLLGGSELEYPYVGQQRRYRGFEFTTDPMFGSPVQATGVLEIREGSDLIFLILDQDVPKPDTIFAELSAASEQGPQIEQDFSPTYTEICDFIRQADGIIKIGAPPGVEDASERIRNGEDVPVEVARLRFNYQGDSRRVTYADGQLEIPLNVNGEDLLQQVAQNGTFREYVVQVFETIFTT